MKILYVITSADTGGAQKYVLNLAKHFHGEIASGIEHQDLENAARANGLSFHPVVHLRRRINPYHDFLAFWELLRLFKRVRPDIIHLNSSKAGFVGSLAGRFCRIPVIFTAHGFIFNQPGRWPATNLLACLERFASRYRTFTIAVSDADRDAALRRRICRPENIQTIHNGLDAILFVDAAKARQRLGLAQNKFIIGTIANLYHRKGLDILVKSFERLTTAHPQAYCLIIGDGPERPQLEQLIQKLGLQTKVQLAGMIPAASSLLKAFDLFVLPSRREGFPYAALEALQAGLPVIATAVGGVAEAMGTTAGLVPPEDSNALTAALDRAIGNQTFYNALVSNSRSRAGQFSAASMLKATTLVYAKNMQELTTANIRHRSNPLK